VKISRGGNAVSISEGEAQGTTEVVGREKKKKDSRKEDRLEGKTGEKRADKVPGYSGLNPDKKDQWNG